MSVKTRREERARLIDNVAEGLMASACKSADRAKKEDDFTHSDRDLRIAKLAISVFDRLVDEEDKGQDAASPSPNPSSKPMPALDDAKLKEALKAQTPDFSIPNESTPRDPLMDAIKPGLEHLLPKPFSIAIKTPDFTRHDNPSVEELFSHRFQFDSLIRMYVYLYRTGDKATCGTMEREFDEFYPETGSKSIIGTLRKQGYLKLAKPRRPMNST